MYEDENHGLFSKSLAEWAIGCMRNKNGERIKARTMEEVEELVKSIDAALPTEFMYTAWYLFNMAIADYPKTLQTDEQRTMFVVETLTDPDGMPENVLCCFEAKMQNANKAIQWERFL